VVNRLIVTDPTEPHHLSNSDVTTVITPTLAIWQCYAKLFRRAVSHRREASARG